MCVSLCFPGWSQVLLESGESRDISDLRPYDQLLTLVPKKTATALTRPKSSSFYTYIHYDKETTAEFLVLRCEGNHQLTISEAHLLYKKSSTKDWPKATMAKNVKIGDYLLHLDDNKEIKNLPVIGIERHIFQGAFAPLTKSGTLIVDGFVVSCYAHVDSQAKAHNSLAPLRLWYQIKSRIGKPYIKSKSKPTDGIHTYAKILSRLYKLDY